MGFLFWVWVNIFLPNGVDHFGSFDWFFFITQENICAVRLDVVLGCKIVSEGEGEGLI